MSVTNVLRIWIIWLGGYLSVYALQANVMMGLLTVVTTCLLAGYIGAKLIEEDPYEGRFK